jgi:hypothetical protein
MMTNRSSTLLAALLSSTIFAIPATAHARLIEISGEAPVDDTSPPSFLDGQRISFSFTFDADTLPALDLGGHAAYSIPVFDVSVSAAGFEWTSAPNAELQLLLDDNLHAATQPVDHVHFFLQLQGPAGVDKLLLLDSSDPDWFSSTASLPEFSGDRLLGASLSLGDELATGTVDTAAVVPEPGEWLMMLCGVGMLALVARLRTRNA